MLMKSRLRGKTRRLPIPHSRRADRDANAAFDHGAVDGTHATATFPEPGTSTACDEPPRTSSSAATSAQGGAAAPSGPPPALDLGGTLEVELGRRPAAGLWERGRLKALTRSAPAQLELSRAALKRWPSPKVLTLSRMHTLSSRDVQEMRKDASSIWAESFHQATVYYCLVDTEITRLKMTETTRMGRNPKTGGKEGAYRLSARVGFMLTSFALVTLQTISVVGLLGSITYRRCTSHSDCSVGFCMRPGAEPESRFSCHHIESCEAPRLVLDRLPHRLLH